MANMVKKTSYGGSKKQIMIADELTFAIGAVIGNTGVSANDDGKKILKAGTPVTGDLEDRNTAFVKATTTEGTGGAADTSDAVAILLHDVDVTAGENNGTIVLIGGVDLNKLDGDVQELITDDVKEALPTIKFLRS